MANFDAGVIPAHPLALTAGRKLDEKRQLALSRYYLDAGVGGLAVGVHTTQFAIREHGMLRPVLELAIEAVNETDDPETILKVAGAIGETKQAVAEAELAAELGYDCVLLSMGGLRDASIDQLIAHAEAVAGVLPVMGFYLQPAVGGRVLPYAFWRRFAAIKNVTAIKIAPFNRYQTLDVIRAVEDAGRKEEIRIFTGNDDNIVCDLLSGDFDGGLLGHWSVWTEPAVGYQEQIASLVRSSDPVEPDWFRLARQVTDANAAFFDAANSFHGCIPGLHEVLRRQGLLAGRWCLDPKEDLSPGQLEEIERVCYEYPHLADDDYVKENLDDWLS